MSLINDALKKAQNVRYEEPIDPAAPAAAGGNKTRIAKRGRAHSANTTILLGSGAIVLVVLSVVATVYLVNRTPEPATEAAAASVAATVPQVGQAATAPAVVAPKLDLRVVAPPGDTIVASIKAATTKETPPAPPPAPVVIAPPGPPKPDEQTLRYVEAIKVAGVRSSGNESRVLMNERVYRVSDIVDRTIGLKLIGVAPGTLTFSDSAGANYVKNF
ncbi:MAG: hypothetical protein ABIQ12_02610 [Opitutaceae bacterium]